MTSTQHPENTTMDNTDITTKIEAALPDRAERRSIVRWVTDLPPAIAALLCAWVLHLAASSHAIGTIRLRVMAVHGYLKHCGVATLDKLTRTAFRDFYDGLRGQLGAQVWYERQRAVLHFLRFALGKDEGSRMAPAPKPGERWATNRLDSYNWGQLRQVWLQLDLVERAQFAVLLGTGARSDELNRLRMDAIDFEPDGLAMIDLPSNGRRPNRWVGLLFGERSLSALVRQHLPGQAQRLYLFPDPRDPTRPMPARHMQYLVRSWGERAGVRGLNPRQLQATILYYMLGRGAAPQFVAHCAGVLYMNRLDRMRDQALSAIEQGHLAGQPYFGAGTPAAGNLACDACGRIDVAADSRFCPGCGSEVSEEAFSEEILLESQIKDRLLRMAKIFGHREPTEAAA